MYIAWKLFMGVIWLAVFCVAISLAAVVVTILAAGLIIGIIITLGVRLAVALTTDETKGSIES